MNSSLDNPNTSSSNRNASGIGILEFSPSQAGQDVTPINLNFSRKLRKNAGGTSLYSLAGLFLSGNKEGFFFDRKN